MKRLLCLLLLLALLCAVLIQPAAAEYPAEDTVKNFENSPAAAWRDRVARGEEIGAVLYVTLKDSTVFEPSWMKEGELDEWWHWEYEPRTLTFDVVRCLYGEYGNEELTVVDYGIDIEGLEEGRNYLIRVEARTPRIPDPRTAGTYLSADEVGDWALTDLFPVDNMTGMIYFPVGYTRDLATFLNTPTDPSEPAVINGNNVNVRQAASTSSRSLGKLNRGDEVTVLESAGSWVKIAWKDGTAYVWGKYVSFG